jgi:FkbM family methyltransferase
MKIKEYSFKGMSYRVSYLERINCDPSWFTFEDETEVRNRDWDIKPGDIIFDIGSAYGSYTLTALAAGASFAYCWNPTITESALLRESIELNGWSEKVKIHDHGLYSKSGQSSQKNKTFSTELVEEIFEVKALDEMDLDLPEGRLWIKIDVEGAELEVLKGAKHLISTRKPIILVENHQFIDSTLEERVREFLHDLGYEQVSCHPYYTVTHSVHKPRLL